MNTIDAVVSRFDRPLKPLFTGDMNATEIKNVLNKFEADHPKTKVIGKAAVDEWIKMNGFTLPVPLRCFLYTVDSEGLKYTDYSNRADADPPTKYGVTYPTWNDFVKNNKGLTSYSSKTDFGAHFTIHQAYYVFEAFWKYVAPFSDPVAIANLYDFAFIAPKTGEWIKGLMRAAGMPVSDGKSWSESDRVYLDSLEPTAQRMLAYAARLDTLGNYFGKSEGKLINLLGWYSRALSSDWLGSDFSFETYPEFRLAVKKWIVNPQFNFMTDRWRKAYFTDPGTLRGKNRPLWQTKQGVGSRISDLHWTQLMA